MTRARALLALSLVTSGAMLGGLSLSGYYEPRPAQSAGVPSAVPSQSVLKVQIAPQGRLRFVAAADETLTPPAAKPKAPAKASATPSVQPARLRPEAKERPEPRPRRQHVSTPWPWSIFGE
jgi:hypothetical protein